MSIFIASFCRQLFAKKKRESRESIYLITLPLPFKNLGAYMWLNKPLWQLRFFFQCGPVLPSSIFQYLSSNTVVMVTQMFFTKKAVEKICKNLVKMFLGDSFSCNYDYLMISNSVTYHTQIYLIAQTSKSTAS